MTLPVGHNPGFSVSTETQLRDSSSTTLVSAIRDGAIQIRKQLDYFRDPHNVEKFEKSLLNATSEERAIVLEVLRRYQTEDPKNRTRPEPIFQFSANPDENENDLLKIVTTLKVLSRRPTQPLTFFQSVLKMTPTMVGLNLWFSGFRESCREASQANLIHKTRSEEKLNDYLQRMEEHVFLRDVVSQKNWSAVEEEFFTANEEQVSKVVSKVPEGILLPSIQKELDSIRRADRRADKEYHEFENMVSSADLTLPGSVLKPGVMDSISEVFDRMISRLTHALSSFFQMFQSQSTPETGALPVLELEDPEYVFDEENGWVLKDASENTGGPGVQSASPWDNLFFEDPRLDEVEEILFYGTGPVVATKPESPSEAPGSPGFLI